MPGRDDTSSTFTSNTSFAQHEWEWARERGSVVLVCVHNLCKAVWRQNEKQPITRCPQFEEIGTPKIHND